MEVPGDVSGRGEGHARREPVREVLRAVDTDTLELGQQCSTTQASSDVAPCRRYPIAQRSGGVVLVFVNHTKGHGSDLGGGNGMVPSPEDHPEKRRVHKGRDKGGKAQR